jgi:hypothetical protein
MASRPSLSYKGRGEIILYKEVDSNLTQVQDSDGGRLPPGIILIHPLATRRIFSLIPTHKSTLWDTKLGNKI